MKNSILLIVTIAVFIVVNFLVAQKEYVLKNGTTILLNLAPRDPRSLIQGDYMVLRYRIAQEIDFEKLVTDGCIVIENYGEGILEKELSTKGNIDAIGYIEINERWFTFRFHRIHDGEDLAKNEHLLRYRKRHGQLQISTGSFFFQEGHAKYYENARFGEVKVTDSGNAVLCGLRSNKFIQLKPQEEQEEQQ